LAADGIPQRRKRVLRHESEPRPDAASAEGAPAAPGLEGDENSRREKSDPQPNGHGKAEAAANEQRERSESADEAAFVINVAR
jgi:hypothetical protein